MNTKETSINMDTKICKIEQSNTTFIFDKTIKNEQQTVAPLDLTRNMMVLGGCATGKTEFIMNLLKQDIANRTIIYDIKGEYTNKFYRKDKDIIFNLEEGSIWNVFEDMSDDISNNERIIIAFISQFLNEYEEWHINFIDKYLSFFEDAFRQSQDNKERWNYLITLIEKDTSKLYENIEKINSTDNILNKEKEYEMFNAKRSHLHNQTLLFNLFEPLFKVLKDIEHQITVLNKPTFSITNFLNTNDCKLFLLNNAAYEALNPLFSAFVSVFSLITIKKPDTTTNLTTLVLDEYLSLNIDEYSLKVLFTIGRSKGIQTITSLQLFNKNDKIQETILNNTYYKVLFEIREEYTLKCMSDCSKIPFYVLNDLPKFHHITLNRDETPYLGYTPINN